MYRPLSGPDGFHNKMTVGESALMEPGFDDVSSTKRWYVFRAEKYFGPLDASAIKEQLEKGYLNKKHHLWRPGFERWQEITNIEEFRAYIGDSPFVELSDQEFQLSLSANRLNTLSAFELDDLDFTENLPAIEQLPAIDETLQRFVEDRSLRAEPSAEKKARAEFFTKLAVILLLLVGIGMLSVYSWQRYETRRSLLALLPATHRLSVRMAVDSGLRAHFAKPVFMAHSQTPFLIGGFDVGGGKDLQMSVEGIPETLLGVTRFSSDVKFSVTDDVFKTPEVKGKKDGPLPLGEYKVSVKCLSCGSPGEEAAVIFTGRFFFGGEKNQGYFSQLQRFHYQVRNQAGEELAELEQIEDTLNQQFLDSGREFSGAVKLPGRERERKWDRFSGSWKRFHMSILDIFSQLEQESFRRKLFYLPIYSELSDVSTGILTYHEAQTGVIKSSSNRGESLKDVGYWRLKIEKQLAKIRNRLESARTRYRQSAGFPAREGLERFTEVDQ